MMFESLSDRIQEIIRKTSGNATLTEENMSDALREIRRALLEADVNLRVVKAFINAVKEKAEGEAVLKSVSPAQQLIKIVNDELIVILGGEKKGLELHNSPSIIMMLGLQGSGKTTSSAKLAIKLKKEGKKPLLVACDVYRPAAVKQLITLGEQIETPVFTIEGCTDVVKIAKESIEYAKNNNLTTIIFDTAGRLQIDTEMMAELLLLDRMFHPDEKLLVIDAMVGQEAVSVAENFNAQLEITGIVLTKLDGDSRGGSALSVVYCTQKPIKLVGMGEKISALEDFYPDRMASRILGMGDIVSLVEKAQENFDVEHAKELERKMRKAEFTFDDFLKLQKQMKMFGSFDQLLGMLPIPGLSGEQKQMIAHQGEGQMKKIEVFISSMTPEERSNPEILNASRKQRIAKGCGIDIAECNAFIRQFEQMRKMMKGVSSLTKGFKGGKSYKGKMPKMPNMPNFPKFPF
ncbi:signal recognition particle protein [bacterium]|nr:signal recognition particle protein [bacterium]